MEYLLVANLSCLYHVWWIVLDSSTSRVDLSQASDKPVQTTSEIDKGIGNMPEMATTNILLVEDDRVDVMNVQRSFRQANIANPLYVANNGVDALAILKGDHEDIEMPKARRLVLLDLNMPKMGGIELLQKIRKDPALRSTPVIVLTTSNQEKDRMEAYNLNVAGYLLKPVAFGSFFELITTLNRYWTLCEIP